MWAAAQTHPQVVDALLESGADVRARSRELHPDGDQRGDAACRPRRAELHRAARRQHGAALRGARPATPSRRGLLDRRRRRRERRAARRRQRARRRRAQRPSAGGDRCCSTKARTRTPPTSATRRCMRRCCRSDLDLVKALLAHGANPNAQITKGTPGQAQQPGLRAAEDADRRDALSACRQVPRSRHHARAGGGRRRHARCR